jgi:hypothetical protein
MDWWSPLGSCVAIDGGEEAACRLVRWFCPENWGIFIISMGKTDRGIKVFSPGQSTLEGECGGKTGECVLCSFYGGKNAEEVLSQRAPYVKVARFFCFFRFFLVSCLPLFFVSVFAS